jgi:tetratricopeptide (TPR) repeat protein
VKQHRDSSDIPGARQRSASVALPHGEPGRSRTAEIEALLDRIGTPAPKAGRWQASSRVPQASPSKLELVDQPLPPPGPSTHAANSAFVARTFATATGTTNAVDYIAIATKEFEEGRIDQPLWARAFVESGGDESSARANYLRARATALRLKARAKQGERADGAARTSTAPAPVADPGSRRREAPDKARRDAARDAGLKPLLRSPITILAVLIVVVSAVTLAIALGPDRSTAEPVEAARPSADSAAANGVKRRLTSNLAAGPVMKQGVMNAIQDLKDAGQWNDVVTQAAAWTEKEPDNAAAWNELSIGYANTHRPDEAHAAARKAVQLAPNNALWWKNLGKLSVARDVPIEALLAYEEATRINPKDGESLVQVGILDARLDRLAEAKLAFENALALNPRDAHARCGTAFVVQKGRPEGGLKPPANAACRDVFEQASRAVDMRRPAAVSDAAPRGVDFAA